MSRKLIQWINQFCVSTFSVWKQYTAVNLTYLTCCGVNILPPLRLLRHRSWPLRIKRSTVDSKSYQENPRWEIPLERGYTHGRIKHLRPLTVSLYHSSKALTALKIFFYPGCIQPSLSLNECAQRRGVNESFLPWYCPAFQKVIV